MHVKVSRHYEQADTYGLCYSRGEYVIYKIQHDLIDKQFVNVLCGKL